MSLRIDEVRFGASLLLSVIALSSLLWARPVQAQFVEPVRVLHQFQSTGGSLGWAVAEIKDLDGDGATDVIVSAPFISRVFVHSGKTGATLFDLTSDSGAGNFGYSISDVGDVDGDGTHDIGVGANTETGRGRAYVFSGATGLKLWRVTGEAPGDSFGSSIGSASDVNDDGFDDVIVGAEQNDAQGNNSGRGYFLSGEDGSTLRTVEADAPGQFLGSGAAGTEDLDGDGVGDVILGARNAGPSARGQAHVVSGATGQRIHLLQADVGGATFGQFFVDGLSDVSGDGFPDLYVGDFSHGAGRGRAYVFSGADGSIVHRIIGGASQGVGPGRGAGDVDGDGREDLAIGHWTSGDGSNNGGKVVIYSGADLSVLMTVTSRVAGANLGFDAVGIGDVDGDCRLDLLCSAATGNRAYVIAGEIDPLGSPCLELNPVPTLGEWGLIVLAVLILGIGAFTTRARMLSIVLALAMLSTNPGIAQVVIEHARVSSAPDQRGLVTANLEASIMETYQSYQGSYSLARLEVLPVARPRRCPQ